MPSITDKDYADVANAVLDGTDKIVETVSQPALDAKDVLEEDLVIITGGQPVWTAGMTNMIQVRRCRALNDT
ncbi:hypothetical protein [uncultured Desulfobacter sp.]|uniref:hypothetical protein n=1 Tax=uncultured Desulfobacter sp. TaxID=240139 RepID=UPI0029C9712C|nr:hypothetical protein [uncultured Desulfobacter sp.]